MVEMGIGWQVLIHIAVYLAIGIIVGNTAVMVWGREFVEEDDDDPSRVVMMFIILWPMFAVIAAGYGLMRLFALPVTLTRRMKRKSRKKESGEVKP